MAFSSLADELDLDGFGASSLSPFSPGPSSMSLGMDLGSSMGGSLGGGMGLSLADELDGPGPDDMDDMGAGFGGAGGDGLGSLALELELELDPMPNGNGHAHPDSFDALGLGTPRRGPHSPRSTPLRSVSRRSLASDPDPGEDDDGDGADLVVLRETMEGSARLVDLLRGLDRPVLPTTSPVQATSGSLLDSPPPLLEDRLHLHLQRLTDSERARDEQTREAAALVREIEGLRGEALDGDIDWTWMEVLAPVSKLLPSAPGWTGEASGVSDHHDGNESDHSDEYEFHPMSNGHADTQATPRAARRSRKPTFETSPSPSPFSPLTPTTPFSPLSPTTPTLPATTTTTLPRLAHALAGDTLSLSSTLGALHESTQLTLALSSGAQRSARGVRAAVTSAREREVTEEHCRKAVDGWEARVAVGDVPDATAICEALVRGFQERLDEYEVKMREVRERMRAVGRV